MGVSNAIKLAQHNGLDNRHRDDGDEEQHKGREEEDSQRRRGAQHRGGGETCSLRRAAALWARATVGFSRGRVAALGGKKDGQAEHRRGGGDLGRAAEGGGYEARMKSDGGVVSERVDGARSEGGVWIRNDREAVVMSGGGNESGCRFGGDVQSGRVKI
ncbi:hypothetical protein V492_02856, partial [Pseudogymnoascus sp. VKM F-4246]